MKRKPPTDPAQPDPDQGHARQWPSTPYSDEVQLPEPPENSACVIALIGDCTIACNYFPPANKPENHLAVRLRRAFKQPFVIRNFGADGDSASNFIVSGRSAQALSGLQRLDIAFVRYGINDRKSSGIDGCIRNLALLADLIKARHPTAKIVFESGIWVDHPAHYLWDRNSRLKPLYDAIKVFAAKERHRYLDIFDKMRAETEKGNWDLRIRGIPGANGHHNVVDDSLDEFFGSDPAYFTNIHPNSACLRLIAQWQVALLREMFNKKLPGPWSK